MTSPVTRKFRKMRIWKDEIKESASQNTDLIWYLLFIFFGAFSVLLFSILLVWFMVWIGWFDLETIKPSILKIVTLFITSVGTIISAIFGVYSKTGTFLKSLQEAGNKPKEELDCNGLSITSTFLKGSQDVIFEQYNEKREGKAPNSNT